MSLGQYVGLCVGDCAQVHAGVLMSDLLPMYDWLFVCVMVPCLRVRDRCGLGGMCGVRITIEFCCVGEVVAACVAHSRLPRHGVDPIRHLISTHACIGASLTLTMSLIFRCIVWSGRLCVGIATVRLFALVVSHTEP